MATFGPIIAERRLVARDDGKVVRVSLGAPRPHGDTGDWACPFRIRGAGLARTEFAYGIDAMQALMSALEGIRYTLDEIGLALDWLIGPGRTDVFTGETGFTRSIPITWSPVVRKRLERVLDRELQREVQAMERRGRGPRRRTPAKSRTR
jgi:hypothetical protein